MFPEYRWKSHHFDTILSVFGPEAIRKVASTGVFRLRSSSNPLKKH